METLYNDFIQYRILLLLVMCNRYKEVHTCMFFCTIYLNLRDLNGDEFCVCDGKVEDVLGFYQQTS
jgi:hypothetical protein